MVQAEKLCVKLVILLIVTWCPRLLSQEDGNGGGLRSTGINGC